MLNTNKGNFKIYKSSAGSGKTFTLVKEYLALALSDKLIDKHPNILAITFTNKAANEMKERILEYLFGLKTSSESGAISVIRNILCEELDLSKIELETRASICLSKILHNYSQFNISTIDKFLISVVRTFSNDLFLNSSFEVNLDKDELLDQAISELVDQAGQNDAITKILSEFVEFNSDNDKSWKVEREIVNYAKLLFSDESHKIIQGLKEIPVEKFISNKRKLVERQKVLEAELYNLGLEAWNLQERLGGESIYPRNGKASTVISKLRSKDFSTLSFSKTILKNIDKGQILKKGYDENDNSEMLSMVQRLASKMEQLSPELTLLNKVGKGLFSLAMLKEIEIIVDQIKEEKNFIPISEFNQKIFEIVSNEPVPFIYERYGNRFKHIMIDEFQDTSVLQWQNLLPLVENTLSEGNENLVVGDAKQAIYRFRGGDVDQFAQLPELTNKQDFPDAEIKEATLKNAGEILNLDTNYRSSESIIEFNNALFESAVKSLGPKYESIYSGHHQKVASKEKGYVELLEIPKGDKENTFEQVLEQVEDCISRNFRQKDIAILVRNGNEGKELAQILNEANYDVISNESFLLSKSTNVQLIIAMLYYTQDEKSIEHQFRLLDLAQKHKGDNTELSSIHFDFIQNKDFNKSITDIGYDISRCKLNELSLYEKVEAIIDTFQIDTRDANVIQLLDVVFSFTNKQGHYLLDFLVWWEAKKDKLNVTIPESLDAIQILTIHKSKGLEFPVVIYPFAYSVNKLSKSNIWYNDESSDIPYAIFSATEDLINTDANEVYNEELYKYQLETLNILYVALTRPAKELYVYTKKSSLKNLRFEQHFLYDFIEKNGSEGIYTLGVQTNQNRETSSNQNQVISFSRNDWRNNIAVAYQNPNSKSVNPQTSYGVQIHEVLSKLDSNLNIESSIQKCLEKGLIESSETSRIKSNIEKLLENKEIKEIFQNVDYYNERELITQNGKVLRPDKIIKLKSEWWVIDFKSGEKNESHKNQINGYIQALNSINEVNRGFLLYTETSELEEV